LLSLNGACFGVFCLVSAAKNCQVLLKGNFTAELRTLIWPVLQGLCWEFAVFMKMALSVFETLSKLSLVRNAQSAWLEAHVISFLILLILKYHFNCSSRCVF